MISVPLTSTFAALFALFYLFLSFRIGYLRGSPVMKMIFKMDEEIPPTKLERNVRAHGNFSEYVPLFLVLLLIMEMSGKASTQYLLIVSLIFSLGRLSHAICFAFFDFNPFLRIFGMISTYLGLAVFSIHLFLNVVW